MRKKNDEGSSFVFSSRLVIMLRWIGSNPGLSEGTKNNWLAVLADEEQHDWLQSSFADLRSRPELLMSFK